MVEYKHIKLKDGFGKIVNNIFTIVPGQIIKVPKEVRVDPNVLEIVTPIKTDGGSLIEVVDIDSKDEEQVISEISVEKEEDVFDVDEVIKKTPLSVNKLSKVKGIGKRTAKDILEIVVFVEDIKDKEQELREKLNDRYVNILVENIEELMRE